MQVDTLAPGQRELIAPRPSFSARDAASRVLTRWGAIAVVSVLTLLGAYLRVRTIHMRYWVDEGLSVGIAGHPLSQIFGLLRHDGSPPLYYVMLHFWMSAFGRGEVATHELSLLFSLITIPVAYWACASLFDRRAGLVGAAIATGTPYLWTYADETRMYTLLVLLALIVATSFVHAFVYRRRRYLPVFALSLTAALYTHNWSLFLGLMAGAAFLLLLRESPADPRRALLRDGLIAFGVVAILYLPWLPTFIYQARHTGAPWANTPTVWSVTQALYWIVGGRGGAVALLLGGGTGLLAVRALRNRPDGRSLYLTMVCLLTLAFGTLLVAFVVSKATPAWAIRYLAVFVGPMIPVTALGLSRGGRLGLVALALVGMFWVFDPVKTSRDTKTNLAAAVYKLKHRLGPDPLVISTQPEQVPTLAYYLPHVKTFGTPLGIFPDPRVVDWRNALEKLRRASVHATLVPMLRGLTPGRRVLLIVPTNLAHEPQWMVLIRRANARWSWYMDHDPRLRRIASISPDGGISGLTVRANLYVVR